MTAERALKLLENRNDRIPSVMSLYFVPLSFAVFAFGGVCYVRKMSKRPIFSGIQTHILLPIAAGIVGKILDDYRNAYYAERDAVFRHYIQLHPEDFVMPERKKYSEILDKWTPVR